MGATAAWAHFDHGADIGVEGVGRSLEEAFEQAAMALTAVVCEPRRVRPEIMLSFRCADADPELLLVDWLNELIYAMSTRGMLFARYAVEISNGVLRGRAWGERVDVARHAPAVEIKGATMTALAVTQINGRWTARCVVDV